MKYKVTLLNLDQVALTTKYILLPTTFDQLI